MSTCDRIGILDGPTQFLGHQKEQTGAGHQKFKTIKRLGTGFRASYWAGKLVTTESRRDRGNALT